MVPHIRDYLVDRGVKVQVTREPGGTEVAEAVRQILLKDWSETLLPQTELLLMFASRSQHVAKVVEPYLEQGDWVICERFTDATRAYQGGGRQISMKFIEAIADLAHGHLWPDLTLYLDIDVNTSMARTEGRIKDRIEKEDIDFFCRVREVYRVLASNESRVVEIDAGSPLEEVVCSIKSALENFLNSAL